MKLPTELVKNEQLQTLVAQELEDIGHFEYKAQAIEWLDLVSDYIHIFSKDESGFEDWDAHDYAVNTSQNNFEPYAIFTKNYVVVHDYI